MTGIRRLLLLLSLLVQWTPAIAEVPDGASSLRAADLRVATIAYRIALAGRPFCTHPHPLTGLLMHHLPEYGDADRQLMIARYGLDRGPGVLSVVAGSPAAGAGLVAGDVLLDINERAFPDVRAMTQERKRKLWRRQIIDSEALIETELGQGPARLHVLRDGKTISLLLESRPGCPARVRLARSTQLNAFADDGYAILTTRIFDLARNDDELAIVIGHELAHIVLDHAGKLKAENVPGGLLRSVGKNAARVRATEEEADRLGLKLAWAAGYDVTAAATFWRRFYGLKGPDLELFRTHPSLAARERALQDAIAELATQPRPPRVP